MQHSDIAIIGAGPAGLAAASTLVEAGLSVTILDEQPTAGGQIYRALSRVTDRRLEILGDDYRKGQPLFNVLNHKLLTFIAQASVWDIDKDLHIFYSCGESVNVLKAKKLLIASGTQERPMPFPGWQLPGVLTVGAAQILLKTAAILPATPMVLAGSGPLLLLLAVQFLRAGHKIEAIIDTTPRVQRVSTLRFVASALKGHALLRKGMALLAEIKKHRVVHIKNASNLHAKSDGQSLRIKFNSAAEDHDIACQTLLIHNGVIPNVQLSRLLGLEHRWNQQQRYWYPKADVYGKTSKSHVVIAGDAAGVAGAEVAELRGHLAALGAAHELGAINQAEPDSGSTPLLRQLKTALSARAFLDAYFAPNMQLLNPHDDTIVCRCEEITASTLRTLVDQGCHDPNQAKSLCRAGMGPCQGRMCAVSVAEIIAARRGISVEDVGFLRVRPPLKPVTLKSLSNVAKLLDTSTDD